jgi:hypothetical protein
MASSQAACPLDGSNDGYEWHSVKGGDREGRDGIGAVSDRGASAWRSLLQTLLVSMGCSGALALLSDCALCTQGGLA